MHYQRRSDTERTRLIVAFHQSGQSRRVFAEEQNINPSTLALWLRNHEGKSEGEKSLSVVARPKFVRVESQRHSDASVTLYLGPAVRMQMMDLPPPQYLAAVVRELSC